jgi:hypothetical protein
MNNKISGFKAFNSEFQCLNFQFEVGKEYEIQGELELCKNGFHFCENPFEVWNYYPPTSRFAAVIGENVIGDGNKSVCSKIRIERELTLNEFIAAGVSRILDLAKGDGKIPATNTGDRSVATNTRDNSVATNTRDNSVATNTGHGSAATNTADGSAATNTGYGSVAANTGHWSTAINMGSQSVATNTGNNSAATNTGNMSAATNSGKNSVALATGYASLASVEGENSIAIATGENSKAKGKIGSWLVLSELINNKKVFKLIEIDGGKYLPDVFYKLKDKIIVSVK